MHTAARGSFDRALRVAVTAGSDGARKRHSRIFLTRPVRSIFILPNMKTSFIGLGLLVAAGNLICANVNAAGTHPAMVGSGGDSFGGQLHYPEKAKAARTQ